MEGDFVTDNDTAKDTALAPGLYMVATPIGNLGDITVRALDVLRRVDLIACEDTRLSRRLLSHYGVSRPLVACHDHSSEADVDRLIEKLKAGAALALISDAGTPLVSDPGFPLLKAAHAADIPVIAIPGPSALTAALSVAGLPVNRVLFEGFLPQKAGPRRRALEKLVDMEATLVFYESPHRIEAMLADCLAIFGDRQAAICRELTKRFEEVRRGGLASLIALYAAGEAVIKGEFVVLVAGADDQVQDKPDIDAALRMALREMSLKEAVQTVADSLGEKRRSVYQRALSLAGDKTS